MPMVKVAVATSDEIIDLALPTRLPIYEIITSLESLYDHHELDPHTHRLCFSSIHGTAYSNDATLESLGIIDGDILLLQLQPRGTSSSPIIEDIADAAALEKSGVRGWNDVPMKSLSLTGLGILISVIALRSFIYAIPLVRNWWNNLLDTMFDQGWNLATSSNGIFHTGTEHPLTLTASVLGIVTLISAIITITAGMRPSSGKRTGSFFTITALYAVGAEYCLCSQQPLVVQTIVYGSFLFIFSTILLCSSKNLISVWTAISTFSLIVTAFAVTTLLFTYDGIVFGAGIFAVGFVVLSLAGGLATSFARFHVPYLPAPGEPIPAALPMDSYRSVPGKIMSARAYAQGLLAAGILLYCLGAVVMVRDIYIHASLRIPIYALITVGAVTAVHKQRLWQIPLAKVWLIAAPFLLSMSLSLTAYDCVTSLVFLVLGILYLISFSSIALVPGLRDVKNYPILLRLIVNIVAFICDCLLLPMAMYIMGVFEWILNR